MRHSDKPSRRIHRLNSAWNRSTSFLVVFTASVFLFVVLYDASTGSCSPAAARTRAFWAVSGTRFTFYVCALGTTASRKFCEIGIFLWTTQGNALSWAAWIHGIDNLALSIWAASERTGPPCAATPPSVTQPPAPFHRWGFPLRTIPTTLPRLRPEARSLGLQQPVRRGQPACRPARGITGSGRRSKYRLGISESPSVARSQSSGISERRGFRCCYRATHSSPLPSGIDGVFWLFLPLDPRDQNH